MIHSLTHNPLPYVVLACSLFVIVLAVVMISVFRTSRRASLPHMALKPDASYEAILAKGHADSEVIIQLADKVTDDWKGLSALKISADLQGQRRKK